MPGIRAPERLETARLLLRRPVLADAEAIFETYASDAEVTRYVGFERHQRIEDTRAFLVFSDAQWAKWPAGPYLIERREDGVLLGSTGLKFDALDEASTGYVLSRSAWGHGYATEALAAMVDLAAACGVRHLYALCHHAHLASAHVLEKGGFTLDRVTRRYADFPNLDTGAGGEVRCYSRRLENASGTERKMRS
jgi:[ribosomal protein S5]-alanine N-acetyltransferase